MPRSSKLTSHVAPGLQPHRTSQAHGTGQHAPMAQLAQQQSSPKPKARYIRRLTNSSVLFTLTLVRDKNGHNTRRRMCRAGQGRSAVETGTRANTLHTHHHHTQHPLIFTFGPSRYRNRASAVLGVSLRLAQRFFLIKFQLPLNIT